MTETTNSAPSEADPYEAIREEVAYNRRGRRALAEYSIVPERVDTEGAGS